MSTTQSGEHQDDQLTPALSVSHTIMKHAATQKGQAHMDGSFVGVARDPCVARHCSICAPIRVYITKRQTRFVMAMNTKMLAFASRLEEKADGAQCVDLVECVATRALYVDKHTKMTTKDTTLTNTALRELDMHLSLQQQPQCNHSSAKRHIVQLHGYHLKGERLHLVQEYCARGDLLAVMRQEIRMQKAGLAASTLNTGCEDGVRRIFVQVLHGVAALHDAGIAHLDLSLENVFITGDDQVRIGDLGLAERFQRNRMGQIVRQCPQSIAKVAYAAPEMHAAFAAGIPIDVSKADAWSLGVILWRLWTKQALFRTTAREDPLYRQMEQNGSVQALKMCPRLAHAPTVLRDLLGRLLDVDPSTRLSVHEALQHPWLLSGVEVVPSPPKLKRVTSGAVPQGPRLAAKGTSPAITPIQKSKVRSGSCGGEIALERTRVSIRGSITSSGSAQLGSPAISAFARS